MGSSLLRICKKTERLSVSCVVVLFLAFSCRAQVPKGLPAYLPTLEDSALIDRLSCDLVDPYDPIDLVDLNEEYNQAYTQFKTRLSKKQLVQLTDHDNRCIRVYAFSALVFHHRYPADSLEQIIRRHVTDTASFKYVSGDQVEPASVIGFMIAMSTLHHTLKKKYREQIPWPKPNYIFEPIEIEITPEDLEDSLK